MAADGFIGRDQVFVGKPFTDNMAEAFFRGQAQASENTALQERLKDDKTKLGQTQQRIGIEAGQLGVSQRNATVNERRATVDEQQLDINRSKVGIDARNATVNERNAGVHEGQLGLARDKFTFDKNQSENFTSGMRSAVDALGSGAGLPTTNRAPVAPVQPNIQNDVRGAYSGTPEQTITTQSLDAPLVTTERSANSNPVAGMTQFRADQVIGAGTSAISRELAKQTDTAKPEGLFAGIYDYFTKTKDEAALAAAERKQAEEQYNKNSLASAWYNKKEVFNLISKDPALLNDAKADPMGFYEKYKDAVTAKDAKPVAIKQTKTIAAKVAQSVQDNPDEARRAQSVTDSMLAGKAMLPTNNPYTASRDMQYAEMASKENLALARMGMALAYVNPTAGATMVAKSIENAQNIRSVYANAKLAQSLQVAGSGDMTELSKEFTNITGIPTTFAKAAGGTYIEYSRGVQKAMFRNYSELEQYIKLTGDSTYRAAQAASKVELEKQLSIAKKEIAVEAFKRANPELEVKEKRDGSGFFVYDKYGKIVSEFTPDKSKLGFSTKTYIVPK